jgi:hypothetical protein
MGQDMSYSILLLIYALEYFFSHFICTENPFYFSGAKTLFLLGITEYKKGVSFDGSNTSNRILDIIEEKRPKIICIDELDKMPRQFQEKLLNFMESGHIKVDKMRKQYDLAIFAACNEFTRLSRPLQSGFRRLHLTIKALSFRV